MGPSSLQLRAHPLSVALELGQLLMIEIILLAFISEPICEAEMVAKYAPTITREQYMRVIDTAQKRGDIEDYPANVLRELVDMYYYRGPGQIDPDKFGDAFCEDGKLRQ